MHTCGQYTATYHTHWQKPLFRPEWLIKYAVTLLNQTTKKNLS